MRRLVGPLLLVLLCACAPPVDQVVDPAGSTIDPSASAETEDTAAPAAPHRTPPAAEAAAPVTDDPAPRRCRAAQLGELRQSPGARLGGPTMVSDLVLRNVSATHCFISGWPGLRFEGSTGLKSCVAGQPQQGCGELADTTSARRNPSIRRIPGSTDAVVLSPGADVRFSIVSTTEDCFDPPYRLLLRVPEDDAPLALVEPFVCLNDDLSITSFGTVAG